MGITSKETMIGVMLAIPFFIRYFMALRDHHLRCKASPSYLVAFEQDESTQKKVDAAIRELEWQRDMLKWGKPEPLLVPTSPYSSTASLQGDMDDFRLETPPILYKLFPTAEDEEDIVDDSDFALLLPKPSPELSDDCDAETSPLILKSASKATERDYLESIASQLYHKAKRATRTDKIGISEALFQLGEILFQEDSKYSSAQRVLQKTERLQKRIIRETLVAVGTAMTEQAEYYDKHGMPELALVYQQTAESLRQGKAGPKELSRAWEIHRLVGKKVQPERKELRSILKRVERRLKRASKEALALSQTLKMEADCVHHSSRQKRMPIG
jgi:hypothetical protein